MNSNSTHKYKNGEAQSYNDITYSNAISLVKTDLFGIGITKAPSNRILEFILDSLKNFSKNYYIVTPNPEMIMLSQKNNVFKHALNNAEIALNDGVGLSFAARFLGKDLKARSTGVDTMKKLCKMVADWPITVGFLGGQAGVAEKTAECLKREYPNLRIVFVGEKWDQSGFDLARKYHVSGITYHAESKESLNTKYIIHNTDINSVDVLFVAFGAPKQELWMTEHLNKIPVKVMMGVGGAFDYISGRVPRAPVFIQKLGLEWSFRLIIQPWRIKRQLALIEFIWMVLRAKLLPSLRA